MQSRIVSGGLMSCAPSYPYVPTFTPGDNNDTCAVPVYNKHRSRLFEGGTYFRSILQGSDWNNITLSIHQEGSYHVLTVNHPDYDEEEFSIIQVAGTPPPPDPEHPEDPPPDEPCSPGIEDMRTLVNAGSNLIEMLPRGDDIEFDPDGEDDLCLSEFPTTYMAGGEGGPTSNVGLAGIRTGPERSIIAYATIEAYDGTPITPPQNERLQQWDGSHWIEYSNLIQGNCPL